jgi:hypothetical protein
VRHRGKTERHIAYNLTAIRELLLAAFTPEDLRRFCLDRPGFRPIVTYFSDSSLQTMVDAVIDYCETRNLWDAFLTELKSTNPNQYARFETKLVLPASGADNNEEDKCAPQT